MEDDKDAVVVFAVYSFGFATLAAAVVGGAVLIWWLTIKIVGMLS